MLDVEIAQGRLRRFDLCGERGQVFSQAGRAGAMIVQLRFDRLLLVDDLREAIGTASKLRTQLIERCRVRGHDVGLAAVQLLGHGGFGLQRRQLRGQFL